MLNQIRILLQILTNTYLGHDWIVTIVPFLF